MSAGTADDWWPVATAEELAGEPLGRQLHGTPVVVFRGPDGTPAGLPDRCPHRFAPLSRGRVVGGHVQCPYHGWRFDSAGRCTCVPGLELPSADRPLLAALEACSEHGLVWLRPPGGRAEVRPTGPTDAGAPLDSFWMTAPLRATVAEAAENFLDAYHTHFVHGGWIRHDSRRQTIEARVRRIPGGVEARYSGEAGQSGVISRLFEGTRGESFGRFRLPGLAEIEYRDAQGALTLLVSAWFTPERAGHLRLHARIATGRGWIPAAIKRLLLSTLFRVVLRQDQRILEQVTQNAARWPDAPAPLHGEQDLLGPWIRRLLSGEGIDDLAERTFTVRV